MHKVLKTSIVSVIILALAFVLVGQTKAASLTGITDTMSRLKKSIASDHTIVFTTPTGAGESTDTITVTYPAGFTIGSVDYTDIEVSATTPGTLTLAAAADATHWGASFTGQVLTLTHPTVNGTEDIVAADVVTIKIGLNATGGDQQITNPATAGSYTVSIAGTFGDTGSLAIGIANEDQVKSTAKVDPYLSFDVTDDNIDLTTLTPTTIKTDTAAMIAATNSKLGYDITVDGGTLTSGTDTITAIGGTPASSVPGTEQFGFCISATGGQGASVYPYNQCGSSQYAFDAANVPDTVAQSTQKTKVTTYTMTYMANIDYDTEPGTYTATHTYICTGNF